MTYIGLGAGSFIKNIKIPVSKNLPGILSWFLSIPRILLPLFWEGLRTKNVNLFVFHVPPQLTPPPIAYPSP